MGKKLRKFGAFFNKFSEKPIETRCMSLAPQNGFRERKVYLNFVFILYNFVQVLNFVHPSFLRYSQFKFGWVGWWHAARKCSFKIKNWIIILYTFVQFCTPSGKFYTPFLFPLSKFGRVGDMQPPPKMQFQHKKLDHNFVLILYNFVHQVPNFVHPSFLRYPQIQIWGSWTHAAHHQNAVSTWKTES